MEPDLDLSHLKLIDQDFLAVIDIDENQSIVALNKTASRILPENCIGKPIDIILADIIDGKKWNATEGMFHIETRGTVPLSMTLFPTRYKSGWRIYGGVCIESAMKVQEELFRAQMISANLGRELRRTNEILARRSAERDLVIKFITHDLRNLVMGITGFTDLIQNQADLTRAEKEGFLAIIAANAKQIDRLLEDFSDLTVEERQPDPRRIEKVMISDLVRGVINGFSLQAKTKDIQLTSDLPTDDFAIYIDRSKAIRIVSNLISNAIKYSPLGSKVHIKAAASEENFILKVADSGPGIPSDELERIFLPLQKGSARPTAGEKSTGLGLAIVKKYMTEFGGTIEVESSTEKGTTFILGFPLPQKPGTNS